MGMGHNAVTEEGGMIHSQVVKVEEGEDEDELFGGEEVADTVAVEVLQSVPQLHRHPWEEVDFDFHVVEVHKWGRKLKVLLLRVVIRTGVVKGVRVVVGSGEELRPSSDVEVLVVDRSDFVRWLCWNRRDEYPALVHTDFDTEIRRPLSQN